MAIAYAQEPKPRGGQQAKPVDPRIAQIQTQSAIELTQYQVVGTDDFVAGGSFEVLENRDTGEGRTIALDFIILPAHDAENAVNDPVFVIAGGPGQAATQIWKPLRWRESPLRQTRDLVFVDQRGTGGNHALRCALPSTDDNLQGYFDPLFIVEPFEKCRDDLSQQFDLTQYSTCHAADDLNELRLALGYDQINLIGGSYGTRASLVYMRQHPQTVRTATLNGIAPISFVNPLYHAWGGQHAFGIIAERCAEQPDCHEAFGDLHEMLHIILERLENQPAEVEISHPTTGELVTIHLSRDAFAMALRVMMYYRNHDVPYLLHRTIAGDYRAFAERGLETSRGLRNMLAMGMLLCVTCAEDIDRIDPDLIPIVTGGTFLGDARVRQQMAVCEIWPRSNLPANYGEPVSVEVPTLILSGVLDPVTPPRWGEEAAKHLPNVLHVVAEGTHGLGGPCIDQIIGDFLDSGTVDNLDTTCTQHMRMPAFYVPATQEVKEAHGSQ